MSPEEQAKKVQGIMGTQGVVTVFGRNIDLNMVKDLAGTNSYYNSCHSFVHDCMDKEKKGFNLSHKQKSWLDTIEANHQKDFEKSNQ